MSSVGVSESRTDADASSDRRLTKDEAFHLLQNTRRRAVLRYLLDHDDDAFVMRDVAEAIAAWEHDTTIEHLHSDERQRVYIALYQSHLPKLSDAGVIDYDQDRGMISPTPTIELLEPYLDEGLETTGTLTPEDVTTDTGLDGVLALLTP